MGGGLLGGLLGGCAAGWARALGGVAAGVDLLELGDADLGVQGGGVGAGVAEKLLDVALIGTAFE